MPFKLARLVLLLLPLVATLTSASCVTFSRTFSNATTSFVAQETTIVKLVASGLTLNASSIIFSTRTTTAVTIVANGAARGF